MGLQTYLDNDVTSKSVQGHVRVGFTAHISHAQRDSQVIAECVQITFCLLNLGELLVTTSLCVNVRAVGWMQYGEQSKGGW